MAALQYVDCPGYSAILFRRTLADLMLAGSLLDRATAWWTGTPATWDESLFGFRFPTRPGQRDATISFGYLRNDADRLRYQSAEYQFVGFDELTQFTEVQYLYLFSRLRRPKSMPVPLRMRAATNPGGPGHHWVKRRFIANAREVETDHLLSPPSKEALEAAALTGRTAEGAHFVRSKSHDNPGLDVAAYQMQLARLDTVTRARLRNGDWDVAESGNIFKPEWWRFLPARPERGVRWVRYWDLAATEPHQGNPDPDWTAGVLLGLEHSHTQKPGEPAEGGRIIIADVVRARLNPGGVQQLVAATARKDGRLVQVRVEEEPGSAGKANTSTFVRLLPGFDVAGHRKTGDKPSFWKPLAAQAEVGNLYLVEGAWNGDFMEECQALPSGPHDDMADAAGGALSQVVEGSDAARLRMLLGK